ncbi:MAG: ribulose-phosphate 3-epimerase [Gemmatimonadetes bacterium]|nr:ribulose-phosphate 3-epimerase [Gemmatimonadota bacterium]
MRPKIAPSILSADFGRLVEQIAECEEAGAEWIHVDVMDGHFVPNITIGPVIVESARAATKLPLDVHLMIECPDRYLEAFRKAGADRITVHQEACPHLHRVVERIRELGAKSGVAINPATPVDVLAEIVSSVDLILLMTVNPGFGGQTYIPASTEKIQRARDLLTRRSLTHVEVEVDGGIDAEHAGQAVRAGATVLVAGSWVFRHAQGIATAIQQLRHAATAVPESAARATGTGTR